MKAKQDIKLYSEAFNKIHWKNEEKIKELTDSIGMMESVIEKHLGKTKEHFPYLTDHSIKHSNMLWEYADIIVGNKKYYLNPLEAFILNGSFLLHDAGICYSILFEKNQILDDQLYKDYIKINEGKIEKVKLEEEALFYTVRENHGVYALRIAKELLSSEEYFISSTDFRDEFADFIGKIAKSHTCNIVYIEREFGSSYTSPKFPKEWSIDFKKIAYLLRVSDAADIDNLRTPKTLKMISEMTGESKEHWTFQKKLGFPSLEHDGHLIYSTNNPFSKNEQKAWWYCYNSLKVLDDELKNANTYFVGKKQEGFDAKSVKYINDTLTLGKDSIKTNGWDSINTSIRVSNPVHIAAELGGKKLYGNVNIAVRELIQNSIDSIHVYRLLTSQDNFEVGKIKVGIENLDDNYYLFITDNGIGMSQNLLTNELLDFGGSYWKTNKFYNDFKGLPSKGFESIGKYGIGFFSSFMLGKEITVTSWKYGENIDAMRTLDFYDGLLSNPTLRLPTDKEKNSIIDRGTSVRIKLENNPYEKKGLIFEENFHTSTLKSLVQYYIPSVDVEINIQELNGTVNSILPNSIDKLSLSELIEYLDIKDHNAFYKKIGLKNSMPYKPFEILKEHSLELIEIIDNGKILGKLLPLPKNTNLSVILGSAGAATILAKGIRVSGIEGFAGYICTDEVVSIKRDQAAAVVPYEAMKIWADKQLKQFKKLNLTDVFRDTINDLTVTFNFHDDNFILAKRKNNKVYTDVSISEFRDYAKNNGTIVIFQESFYEQNKMDSYDGFINVSHGLPLKSILIDSDLEKTNGTQKIITSIIKEEWQEYEEEIENNIISDFSKKDPYMTKWTFIKKVKIL